MRILLVTLHDILPFAITQVLNPANDYCAIVVDEVEPAKKFIKSAGGSENIVYPFYELKECLEKFHYDCVLSFANDHVDGGAIIKNFKYCKIPLNKCISFAVMNTAHHFLLRELLLYYKRHASEFEIFSTGMSYTSYGLNFYQFKNKFINFAYASQDLYYDCQIAKYVFNTAVGGGG